MSLMQEEDIRRSVLNMQLRFARMRVRQSVRALRWKCALAGVGVAWAAMEALTQGASRSASTRRIRRAMARYQRLKTEVAHLRAVRRFL